MFFHLERNEISLIAPPPLADLQAPMLPFQSQTLSSFLSPRQSHSQRVLQTSFNSRRSLRAAKPSFPSWFTQDARLTVASPTRDLPPKWSIKSQVPPVHDEDSVLIVDFAKKRYLQRREEFSRLLQKPDSELRDRRQELRNRQECVRVNLMRRSLLLLVISSYFQKYGGCQA